MDMIEVSQGHTFALPIKKINEGSDLSFFLTSSAYTDVTAFLAQLNHAMFPMLQTEGGSNELRLEKLDSQVGFSHPIIQLQSLLQHLGDMVNDVPPDSGPRRFGNVSFRRWYETLEERSSSLLTQYLPRSVNEYVRPDEVSLYDELRAYFLGSFGSAQRLDYGTGHELSFLAFIGGLWKLDGFQECREAEKEIVLGVVEPYDLAFAIVCSMLIGSSRYLELVRKLIKTYTLEPAGSHGVWGLDDHSFLPYIFGSAQFGPAIGPNDPTPLEGSLKGAPKPSTVTDPSVVEDLRAKNMYYSAIGFIYDVKKGPFWEHSPYLYDISGIEAGWGKINKV